MSTLLALFLIVYVVYHVTLLPSTPGGDSGELLAEACILGTPHPPGYPFFTILSNLGMRIPLPRVYFSADYQELEIDYNTTNAWRVNHMCSIFGALTAVLLASSSKRLFFSVAYGPSAIPSNTSPVFCIGAMLFVFSPLVWEYALSAEVFALNNLLCAVLIWLTCLALCVPPSHNAQKLVSIIAAGAFISGLAMTNQHTSLFALLVLVPAVLISAHRHLSQAGLLLRTYSLSGICFIFGLSPYLYLVYSGSRPTRGSWGDTATLRGLIRHILRSEYGTFQLGAHSENTESGLQRLWLYLVHSSRESFHVGYVLAGLGIILMLIARRASGRSMHSTPSNQQPKGSRPTPKTPKDHVDTVPPTSSSPSLALLLSFLSAWVFYVLLWHCTLSNLPLSSPMPFGVHARFWMQPNLFLAVLMGAGSKAVISTIMGVEKSFLGAMVEYACVLLVLSVIIGTRFALMDRSRTGSIMHKYGEAALTSLPSNSLLLSHTDLDWNPIRYLRECQGVQTNVTHLSIQLLPYPWFRTQQRPLYPNVVFPDTEFQGVSTKRGSEGNAKLVRDVLLANGVLSHTASFLASTVTHGDEGKSTKKKNKARAMSVASTPFAGGLYCDMQAISDLEITDGHGWRGLHLIPWGTLYRVVAVELHQSASLHIHSLRQLRILRTKFAGLWGDDTPRSIVRSLLKQYMPGTWEFAVFSVLNDAQYQVGMCLLTFAIAMQPQLKADNMGILALLVDRLYVAADLLTKTYTSAAAAQTESGDETLSSPLYDVFKNAALAWMRLEGVFALILQFQENVEAALEGNDGRVHKQNLLNDDLMNRIVTPSELHSVRVKAIHHIDSFLRAYSGDRDAGTFRTFVEKLRDTMRNDAGSM